MHTLGPQFHRLKQFRLGLGGIQPVLGFLAQNSSQLRVFEIEIREL